MVCPACKREVQSDAIFCPYCGKRIASASFTGDFIALRGSTVVQAQSVVMGEKADTSDSEEPHPDTRKDKTAGRIIFCTNCGLRAGQPGMCTHPDGHRFLRSVPKCSIVYCQPCAVVPANTTQCHADAGNSLVEATPFCPLVY